MAVDKDIKRDYKENPPAMGVYCILNKSTNKYFVGWAMNVNARINRHKFELEQNAEGIAELQEDYRLSGMNNFEFEVLDTLKPKEETETDIRGELQLLRDLWIEKQKEAGFLEMYSSKYPAY